MKELNIWKVSQSKNYFTDDENDDLFNRNCVCVHPDTPAKGKSYSTQGEDFSNVEKGDFFYLCYGNKRIRLFGMFTGESQPSKLENKPDWLEQKYIPYFESISNEKYQGNSAWWTPSDNSTFTKCKNNEEFQEWILKPFFSKTLKDIDMMTRTEDYVNLLINNRNLILTGAPGTGKTYLAKQIAKKIVMQKRASQPIEILKSAIDAFIHSDSNNEKLLDDFTKCFPINDIENMTLDDYCIGKGDKESFCYWIERRLKSLGYYSPGTSNSYLLYWNKDDKEYKVAGYLKKESETDPKSLMKILAGDISKFVKDKDNPEIYTDKFGESFILKVLNSYYRDDYFPVNSRRHINNIISLFDLKCNENISIFKKNKIINEFYKKQCDGKGISSFEFMHILYENFNIKDGEIKEENGEIIANGEYEMVQFHPSYDYTDFVEGLRPIGEEKDNNNVTFKRKDGVFKKLCVKAKINPNKNYVLVIDEINRGEISKIFGELFFSIDPGYRGTDGLVQTQYQNLVNDDDEFSEGFFVPKNVYIIGTMNDIDRSVESMDFAFRRRFAFKEVTAEESQEMLDSEDAWNGEKPDGEKTIPAIKNRMDNLNDAIWHEPKENEKEEEKSIEGLSSAYHIGASYFLKLVNYKKDGGYNFEELWDYHLKGLLFEYLRGMQDVEGKLKKLHKAYQNDKPRAKSKSTENNNDDSTSVSGQPEQ